MSPRRPQEAQNEPQEAPGGPKWAPGRPRRPERRPGGPRRAKRRPRRPQEAPTGGIAYFLAIPSTLRAELARIFPLQNPQYDDLCDALPTAHTHCTRGRQPSNCSDDSDYLKDFCG